MKWRPYCSPSQVEKRRKKAQSWGLHMVPEYWQVSTETLAGCCNGPGPEKFGVAVLAVSSFLLQVFLVSCDGHDLEWSLCNDGSRFRFDQSNERFDLNNHTVAKREPVVLERFRPLARPRLHGTGEALAAMVRTPYAFRRWQEVSTIEPGPEVAP